MKRKKKQKKLEQKKEELKKEKMRLSQNDKLRTQLESKMGSEASILQEEQNKLNKDNIMMKKLMEDFNNISNQIKGLLNLIEEKRNKTAKN